MRTGKNTDLDPQGQLGIEIRGHRDYVGGLWDQIGNLQLEFLVSKGLKPEHYLLDIACGALRLGVKAIPYLDKGRYLGIEKESKLVELGVETELGNELLIKKMPELVISSKFEFEKFTTIADFSIAQSLFTHLPAYLIQDCFRKLASWLKKDSVFYATFFETEQSVINPDEPHDHGYFAYKQSDIVKFGSEVGFAVNYIGDWSHPRQQVIVEYKKTT